MTEKFFMKQNDLKPDILVKLLDGTTAVDLTSAVGVRFLMKGSSGLKISRAMTVADALTGEVSMAWSLGDTDTVGNYKAEIEVMWPSSKPQTFPSNAYFVIVILDDLDP